MAHKQTPEELAASIGFSKAFFYSDPELARLIRAATRGQWSPQKFQAAFMNTKWYRHREAAVRQWTDLSIRDPGEARDKVNNRKTEMRDMMSQLGLRISEKQITKMATDSLKYAWTQAQTKDILANMVVYNPGHMGGTPATLEMQMKQMASDYGVNATDKQIGDWINGLLSERYTNDNITDFLRDSAKSKYAGMAPWLDKGMTVKEVAGNHIESYSRLLELDPDTVDLMDPTMQKALQGTPDPKTGVPVMQTVYDFEKTLRKDPRWLKTKNAHSDMTNAAIGIARDWGLVA